MTRRLEILSVYLTGFLQGLVLVVVPSAGLVFTGPNGFDFSSSEYGALFIPQVLGAIVACLLGPSLAKQWGIKTVYRIGLFFNVLAMSLIAASQGVMANHHMAYAFVILGTGFVGAAFGLTLPAINVYATNFFPNRSASALSVLYTLLGAGTALAPYLVTVLVWVGWWLLPLYVAWVLMVLWAATFILSLQDQRLVSDGVSPIKDGAFLPSRVKLFMLIIFLYGFCETIFANWAIIFLNKEKGFSLEDAGYALAAFWVMVSVGRLLISILSIWVSAKWIYMILPVFITMALLATAKVSNATGGVLLFGFAGLACSGFFPLTFSFGQKGFEYIAERVSGWIMAAYMLGFGVAAYGVGQVIEKTYTTLGVLYRDSTIIALVVFFLTYRAVARSK